MHAGVHMGQKILNPLANGRATGPWELSGKNTDKEALAPCKSITCC